MMSWISPLQAQKDSTFLLHFTTNKNRVTLKKDKDSLNKKWVSFLLPNKSSDFLEEDLQAILSCSDVPQDIALGIPQNIYINKNYILGTWLSHRTVGEGLEVGGVILNSYAAKLGIQKGDIITHVERHKVHSTEDFLTLVRQYKRKEGVLLEWKRNHQIFEGKIPMGDYVQPRFKRKKSGVKITKLPTSQDLKSLLISRHKDEKSFQLTFNSSDTGTVKIYVLNAQGVTIVQDEIPNFYGQYMGNFNLPDSTCTPCKINIDKAGKVISKKINVKPKCSN